MIKRLLKDKSFIRITKHSLNYGLGDVLAQVIGFILIPLYTQYLTTSDYGIVDIVGTIGGFAIPLMKLGLPGSVTRQYYDYKDNPSDLVDYITTIYKLLNWSAIIIGIILLIILLFLSPFLFEGIRFWPFIVLPIITAGLGANNQLQQKVIQNEEKSAYSVKIRLAFTFFSIISAVFFITYLGWGALGFILADLIVAFSFFIQAYFFLGPYIKGKFNRSMAKEGLNYGTGLLPSHLAASAAPLLNKTLLINMGSLSSLGIFSIGMRFIMPLEILYNMISTAFTPIYNSLRKDGLDQEINKNVKLILGISFVSFTIAQFFGPPIMRWMLPKSYHPSINLLPIISLAFIGRTIYGISVNEVFYARKTKFVSVITIGGLVVNTLVCVAFVAHFQEIAISWAYAANFFLWGLLAYFYKRKVSDFNMFTKEITMFLFASGLVSIISFIIN